MTATPIFDSLQAGLARKNDRLTSVLAAEQVTDVHGTKRAVLEILRELGPLPDEYIHREHTHLARVGIVPRRLSPHISFSMRLVLFPLALLATACADPAARTARDGAAPSSPRPATTPAALSDIAGEWDVVSFDGHSPARLDNVINPVYIVFVYVLQERAIKA